MSTARRICFVIMPFSETTKEHTDDYWNRHFESFLKPLIEENRKLEARRSQPLRGNILNQIITDLVVSEVVVADLTDRNPNVYWELGVRQSFKHGTITIMETGTRLPFDIGGKGTLPYFPKDHLKNEGFRSRFKQALQDCLSYPERPDSYVLESIFGRGTLFELFRRDEATRRLDAVLSECSRNSGILDKVVDRVNMNQKDPENRKFTTNRLAMSSVELLVTNRYIDKDRSFFTLAENYLGGILSVNEALNRWKESPVSTEKWLVSFIGTLKKRLEKFETEVEDAREKIRKRV